MWKASSVLVVLLLTPASHAQVSLIGVIHTYNLQRLAQLLCTHIRNTPTAAFSFSARCVFLRNSYIGDDEFLTDHHSANMPFGRDGVVKESGHCQSGCQLLAADGTNFVVIWSVCLLDRNDNSLAN